MEDQSTTQRCGETSPLQMGGEGEGEGDPGRGGVGARRDEEGEEGVVGTDAKASAESGVREGRTDGM